MCSCVVQRPQILVFSLERHYADADHTVRVFFDLGGSGPCLAGTIDELVDNQYEYVNECPNDLDSTIITPSLKVKFTYTWFRTVNQSMKHHSKVYISCNTVLN